MSKQPFATMASPAGAGGFYASFARMITKHYGAHTAHGERAVRKPGNYRNVMKPCGRLPETFPTRKEALEAARVKAIQAFNLQ